MNISHYPGCKLAIQITNFTSMMEKYAQDYKVNNKKKSVDE
jgi:hypothetical protein